MCSLLSSHEKKETEKREARISERKLNTDKITRFGINCYYYYEKLTPPRTLMLHQTQLRPSDWSNLLLTGQTFPKNPST